MSDHNYICFSLFLIITDNLLTFPIFTKQSQFPEIKIIYLLILPLRLVHRYLRCPTWTVHLSFGNGLDNINYPSIGITPLDIFILDLFSKKIAINFSIYCTLMKYCSNVLSQCNTIGPLCIKPNSYYKLRSHNNSHSFL